MTRNEIEALAKGAAAYWPTDDGVGSAAYGANASRVIGLFFQSDADLSGIIFAATAALCKLASRRGGSDGQSRNDSALAISRSMMVAFPATCTVSKRLNQGLIAGSREL